MPLQARWMQSYRMYGKTHVAIAYVGLAAGRMMDASTHLLRAEPATKKAGGHGSTIRRLARNFAGTRQRAYDAIYECSLVKPCAAVTTISESVDSLRRSGAGMITSHGG